MPRHSRKTIERVASVVMNGDVTIEELLNKRFPMNAKRVAEECLRMSKAQEFGSAWTARAAQTIAMLLQHIDSISTNDHP